MGFLVLMYGNVGNRDVYWLFGEFGGEIGVVILKRKGFVVSFSVVLLIWGQNKRKKKKKEKQ